MNAQLIADLQTVQRALATRTDREWYAAYAALTRIQALAEHGAAAEGASLADLDRWVEARSPDPQTIVAARVAGRTVVQWQRGRVTGINLADALAQMLTAEAGQ
jgi:hypothetical protein